ncbi:MAG: GNAT family N-acetyltransferase [Candidatus Omnitrophota bacterium]|nr:GNAT family N-acetyltransferase [Candidatus Omnitrophota bacterium]
MSLSNDIKATSEISGERITLRKLRFSDSEDIYQNVKDREIIRWTLNIPHPYFKDSATRFIRKTHYDARKKKAYAFGIMLKKENKVIGVITLLKLDYKNRNAEIGYWLGKRYWEQGFMTEAAKLLIEFGFRRLKLHKIYAGLFEENIASRRVLEKSGFKLEGKIREPRFRYGKWHNELRYGILYSEYKSR